MLQDPVTRWNLKHRYTSFRMGICTHASTRFITKPTMIQKLVATANLPMTLSGCATAQTETVDRYGYFADDAFKATTQNEYIRFLDMHYTALDDKQSLKTLTEGQVSAHYSVPKKPDSKQGKAAELQLVDENKRAWHSGPQ